MRRPVVRGVMAAFAVASLPLACGLALAAAPALVSTRGLLSRLSKNGHAEAELRTTLEDPLGGPAQQVRGKLTLERPRYARLDFPSGERMTLREDGGDWLQPRTRQLIRGGPDAVAEAVRWWGVLLESAGDRFVERPLGKGGYELRAAGADSAAATRQRVWLGADGLPSRLEVVTPDGSTRTWRLQNWHFGHARGRAAFVLSPPTGYEVVELP
jgi:hypothetical protein